MEKSKTKEDASPLSTSTESETFETWTLITDKQKDLVSEETAFTPLTPEKSDDDDGENADDTVHVEPIKDPELLHERYNDTDDLSDGISIISECESAGRLSPHPELRKRLSDLNMLFINVPESARPAATTEDSFQTQNYDASSERSADTLHRVEPLMECNRSPRKSSSHQITQLTGGCTAIHGGLRGLFYVGALLAIIAFIGKLKYDTWESVLGSKTALLTQKITELELNNNLMRAEIDILSKQVKYLTTLSENQKSAPASNKPKNSQPRENAFKAWPGHGNKIEEVLITSEDLKKPYKCDGHNNVDLAGMCIELNDGIKVDDINENADFPVKVDKIIEPLPKVAENPFVEPVENLPLPAKESPAAQQQPKSDYTPHEHKASDQSRKQEKREKKHSKNHSAERKDNDRPRRNRSSEEKDRSGERYKKEYKKNGKPDAAEYEKAKRIADGYWHEKMMQHRENYRKNNEKYDPERNDKNWYIERGDSREQARYDHKNRGNGQR